MTSELSNFIDEVEYTKEIKEDASNTNIPDSITGDNIILYALIDLLIYKDIFTIDEWEIAQTASRNCFGICSIEQEISILNNMLKQI